MAPSTMQAPTWFLDYKNCTLAELRSFIIARAGSALDERGRQKLQSCNRVKLTFRLRKLDQNSTFPCFMELPPELRFIVFESLLVDERVWNDGVIDWQVGYDNYRIHLAVLRTSKQIYSEAVPILYNQNKSHVMISHGRRARSSFSNDAWALDIMHPGRRFPVHQKMPDPHGAPVLRRLSEGSTTDMMRALKHLSISLNLVAPQGRGGVRISGARDALAVICLSLTGASKLEELKINLSVEKSQIGDSNLADILWPLLFLRTEVVVSFEGFEGVPALPLGDTSVNIDDKAGLPAWLSSYGAQRFCDLVAGVRIRCKDAREHRSMDIDRLTDIEEVLDRMGFSGAWADVADIVSSSAKWRGMQGCVDDLEATGAAYHRLPCDY